MGQYMARFRLPILGLIALLTVGCSVNGGYLPLDQAAIEYGKQVEPLAAEFGTLRQQIDQLEKQIDPGINDVYSDEGDLVEEAERPASDLAALKEQQQAILQKCATLHQELSAIQLKLKRIEAPQQVGKFHTEFTKLVATETQATVLLPKVVAEILEKLDFNPGTELVRMRFDAAQAMNKLDDRLNVRAKYRNPWLIAASQFKPVRELTTKPGFWADPIQVALSSAFLVYLGSMALLMLMFAGDSLIEKWQAGRWLIITSAFLLMLVLSGIALAYSVGITAMSFGPNRWPIAVAGIVPIAGMLTYGWLIAQHLDSVEDPLLLRVLLLACTIALLIGIWAYFDPQSLPQPFLWSYAPGY